MNTTYSTVRMCCDFLLRTKNYDWLSNYFESKISIFYSIRNNILFDITDLTI